MGRQQQQQSTFGYDDSVDLTEEKRIEQANIKLQKLLDEQIRPTFEQLTDQQLRDHLSEHVDVSTFSVEGDELHQLIDCIVLGPYVAADLHAMPKNHVASQTLPRRQYHRGQANSRNFEQEAQTADNTLSNQS